MNVIDTEFYEKGMDYYEKDDVYAKQVSQFFSYWIEKLSINFIEQLKLKEKLE
jgi:hypothetical protein